MTELSDSPEVQAFMAAFQQLRNLVGDTPELIVGEARDNESLHSLCYKVSVAHSELCSTERSQRELYVAPTNRAFLTAS
jgi:hypothetical protein